MKWLESPRDEVERELREGLEQAARRTGDELTHRRVWAKIADASDEVGWRPRGRLVTAMVAATLCLLAGAGGLTYRHLHERASTPVATSATENGSSPLGEKPMVQTSASEGTDEAHPALAQTERAPGRVIQTRSGERAHVSLGGGAKAELDENSAITWDAQLRPSIEHGNAQISVPHQPPGWQFSLTAGPYVIAVVGTKFDVHIAPHTVGVEVTEGVVEVWRGSRSTRLMAGDTWHGPLDPDTARADDSLSGPTVFASGATSSQTAHHKPRVLAYDDLQTARLALQAGEQNRAVDILSRAALGTGPAAENAAYELGRITRDNLGHPRQALVLWDRYRTRFPTGLLRTETDLSMIETLARLGDTRAALTEAEAFVSRHPSSERRAEIQQLAERLRTSDVAPKRK